jgi:lysophospholipase L1-like esterase
VVDNRQWGKVDDCTDDRPLWGKLVSWQWRGITDADRVSPFLLRMQLLPGWVFWSLAANGVFVLTMTIALWRQPIIAARQPIVAPVPSLSVAEYQQSVAVLKDDAKLVAAIAPPHLAILAGDSISLRFPAARLPGYRVLNQGISGDTAAGLSKRLSAFDQTQPEVIFVMIGINDLLRGRSNAEILADQQRIIQDLKTHHPKAKIVIQSVLPHATEQVTWEGHDRLLSISNRRIKALNDAIKAIANKQSIHFFNLYPLFADSAGNLRRELSSDGLHLSDRGYEVWSIALQVYGEEVLKPAK